MWSFPFFLNELLRATKWIASRSGSTLTFKDVYILRSLYCLWSSIYDLPVKSYSLHRRRFRCCVWVALYASLGIPGVPLTSHHYFLCFLAQCLPSSIAYQRHKGHDHVCLVHHYIPSSYYSAWYTAGIQQIYIWDKWILCVNY